MQTTWKIQNVSKRPITVIRDTGRALHLNPGCSSELTTVEIEKNTLIAKLIKQNLLKRIDSDASSKKTDAEKKEAESGAAMKTSGKSVKKH
jgi:hypothetical protein